MAQDDITRFQRPANSRCDRMPNLRRETVSALEHRHSPCRHRALKHRTHGHRTHGHRTHGHRTHASDTDIRHTSNIDRTHSSDTAMWQAANSHREHSWAKTSDARTLLRSLLHAELKRDQLSAAQHLAP